MEKPEAKSAGWTEDQDKIIRDNYRIISTREIAVLLGRTRNSVIGRASRIGLGKPYKEVFPEKEFKEKVSTRKTDDPLYVRKDTGIMALHPPAAKKRPFPVLNDNIIPLNGVGIKIWDIETTSCRWVVGDPKDITYCGHQRKTSSSYCPDHHNWTLRKK